MEKMDKEQKKFLGIVYFWLEMMKRLLYPLNKIVRRIKEKMKESVLLNLGVMGVPIGLLVAFEALKQGDSLGWTILGVWGVILSLVGVLLIFVLFRDARKKDREKEAQQRVRDKVLVEMLSQLVGLRQDLKGGEGQNGRNKNS